MEKTCSSLVVSGESAAVESTE